MLQRDLNEVVSATERRTLPQMGGNASRLSLAIRDKFKSYFVPDFGSLPWQAEVVRRGFHNKE